MAWTNTGSMILTTSLLIFWFKNLKQFSLYETLGNVVISLKLWHLLTCEPPVAWITFFKVCQRLKVIGYVAGVLAATSHSVNLASFALKKHTCTATSKLDKLVWIQTLFLNKGFTPVWQINLFGMFRGSVENWTWNESTMPLHLKIRIFPITFYQQMHESSTWVINSVFTLAQF